MHVQQRDFFLSYTSADAEIAAVLNDALREADYSTWFHQSDKKLGAGIAQWMFEALNASSQMIAIASPNYFDPAKGYSAAERNSIFMEDPTNRDAMLILVKVRDVDIPMPFNQSEFIDLTALTPAAAGAQLVALLQNEEARAQAEQARERAQQERLPDIFNVDGVPSPYFFGRDRVSEALASALGQPGGAVVSLVGMAGLGKSTVARDYVFRHARARDFVGVWWVSAETEGEIVQGLIDLAAQDGVDVPASSDRAAVAAETVAWVARQPAARPVVLVFDNVTDLATVKLYLPGGSAKVILTSRNTQLGTVSEVIELSPWTDAETSDFLQMRIGRGPELDVAPLVGRIAGLPLAAEQVGAYLAPSTLSPEVYVDRFVELLKRDPPPVSGTYSESVYAALALSVEAIRETKFGDAAIGLLELCALMAPSGVEIELLRGTAKRDDLFPEDLRDTLRDPVLEADAFSVLNSYSLMRTSTGPHGLNLHMHRLLAEVLRDWTPPGRRSHLSLAMVQSMHHTLPSDNNPLTDSGLWVYYDTLCPHLAALYDYEDWSPRQVGYLDWLLNQAGLYFSGRGRPKEGAEMMARSLDLCRRRRLDDVQDLIMALIGYAGLLIEQYHLDPESVDLAVVRALCEEARTLQLTKNQNNPWTEAIILTKLSAVASLIDDFNTAVDTEIRALEIAMQDTQNRGVLSERQSSLASCLVKRFEKTQDRQDMERAYSLLSICNADAISQHGPRSLQWAKILTAIGAYLMAFKDEAGAVACLERIVCVRFSLGIDDGAVMQETVRNLAIARANAGDEDAARALMSFDLSGLRHVVYEVEVLHALWARLDPQNRPFGPPPQALPKSLDFDDFVIPEHLFHRFGLDMDREIACVKATADPARSWVAFQHWVMIRAVSMSHDPP